MIFLSFKSGHERSHLGLRGSGRKIGTFCVISEKIPFQSWAFETFWTQICRSASAFFLHFLYHTKVLFEFRCECKYVFAPEGRGGGGLYRTRRTACVCFEGDWASLVWAGQECSSVSRDGAVYFSSVPWPSWELEAATMKSAPLLSTHETSCIHLPSHSASLYMPSHGHTLFLFHHWFALCGDWMIHHDLCMLHGCAPMHPTDGVCVYIYVYINLA